jgi:hypothetical protein
MDSTDKWSKRPHSTIGQRNVDKELERVKSLAVVSVLNKSFEKDTVTPSRASSLLLAPTLSPSSSLTTDNETFENVSSLNRSQTIFYTTSNNDYPSKKSSNSSLHSDFSQNIPSSRRRSEVHMLAASEEGFVSSDKSASAEKESNTGSLVISSPIDTEKENLQKRVQELQDLYSISLRELRNVEARSDTQKELVMIQDQLIQNMSNQLEALTTETKESENAGTIIEAGTDEGKQALYTAQRELQLVKNELLDIKSVKTHYESIIAVMKQQISAYDVKMNELEKIAKNIQKENATQIEYIDTKVQTLIYKLLERDETINKLQVEQIQEKQSLSATKNDHVNNNNSSVKNVNDSSSVIWETYEEEKDGDFDSTRSSYISTASRNGSQKRKSFIARWKGSAIPPASPPPSLPLPPIPSNASHSRPRSTLSEIYASTSSVASIQNKHISMDAVGRASRRRPSNQSEIEVQMTDAAYYKEFTDQLQERLSISKEIDDLRVWEPADYDAIQKKIESKGWSSGDDSSSQKDQSAFWKGMKKKLGV